MLATGFLAPARNWKLIHILDSCVQPDTASSLRLIMVPGATKGNSMPAFLFEWDDIALVQHFLRTYFLASQARCALAIPRDPVVDARQPAA